MTFAPGSYVYSIFPKEEPDFAYQVFDDGGGIIRVINHDPAGGGPPFRFQDMSRNYAAWPEGKPPITRRRIPITTRLLERAGKKTKTFSWIILLLVILSVGLSCYNRGRHDERRADISSYQDGVSAGVRLGCAARGRAL